MNRISTLTTKITGSNNHFSLIALKINGVNSLIKCSMNICQIHLVHNFCEFTVSLFSFCFHYLSIAEGGMLKSPMLLCGGVMCAMSFSKVSFMNVGSLAFGAQIFTVESSFWQIFPLIRMKFPSLSFLITLGRKSILFDIRMATPAISLGIVAGRNVLQPFTLRQCLSLSLMLLPLIFVIRGRIMFCGYFPFGLLKEEYFLAFSRVQFLSLCWSFPFITL